MFHLSGNKQTCENCSIGRLPSDSNYEADSPGSERTRAANGLQQFSQGMEEQHEFTMACLIFRVDGHEVARRRLDRRIVIGRSAACDISIREPLLSRQHCQIDFDGRNWVVSDLRSRNGTWMNDQRIERQHLRSGDHVRIGIVSIFFKSGDADEPRLPVRGFLIRKSRRAAEPSRRLPRTFPSKHAVDRSLGDDPRNRPSPCPRPADPRAYCRENLYLLFARIAADSCDDQSTLPAARLSPARPMPIPRSRNYARRPLNIPTEPGEKTPNARRNRWSSRLLLTGMRLAIVLIFVISVGSDSLRAGFKHRRVMKLRSEPLNFPKN